MSQKHVIVVGAGPGGLTSAMLLARRGCKVTVFEKAGVVGGRNAPITDRGYTWDTGPTFLMMSYILKEMFQEADRRVEDYLQFTRLDPLYRLVFENLTFSPSANPSETRARIAEKFPGNEEGFDRFMAAERKRFLTLFPCLQKDYASWTAYLDPIFLKAAPQLSLGRTIFGKLGDYFTPEMLKICFTFQAKYLGMSPWDCPAFFTMLPYLEHEYGVFHVRGGLNRISEAMAAVTREHGGEIRLGTPVRKVLVSERTVRGVELEDGTKVEADGVFLNADFGYAMQHLFEPGVLRKYTSERLSKMKVSCSTYMLYLGVNRRYDDLPHHNIIFSTDYQRNIEEVARTGVLSEDPSVYVQNASVTDPTVAPEGHSTIYILAPVPNVRAGIRWDDEADAFRERVLDRIEGRGGFTGLRDHIEVEKRVTPADWVSEYRVFEGATFNLAHNFFQLLSFRPRNRFEELDGCWLVGGGTHPGSGLPTIYESARISCNSFCRESDIPFDPPTSLLEKEMLQG